MIQTVKHLKRKLVKIFINYTRCQVHGSAHVSVKFVDACDFHLSALESCCQLSYTGCYTSRVV